MMKTIKTRLIVVLWAVLIPMLTANCSDKKTAGNTETAEKTAEATAKTESVIKVTTPPFQKFVVVTTEDAGLHKKADTSSPNLVRWFESDCESDFCENFYQWSDQPGKPGFELSTEIMTYEGRVLPVLAEEGNFYKVSTLSIWCDIESAYISKDCVGDIESAPITADMLEAPDNFFKCRVVKDGKYKDIVLIDEYDELDGETLKVGVLKDGTVACPLVYWMDSSLKNDQEEALIIDEMENNFFIRFNKSMAVAIEEDYEGYQLNLKKLSDEQIAKIVDTVTGKKPEYVDFMYQFPAQGPQSFIYKVK